jgi:uncharacterized protein YccT (UPF0319 family)
MNITWNGEFLRALELLKQSKDQKKIVIENSDVNASQQFMIEFNKMFDNVVDPVVAQFNEKLNESGFELEIYTNEDWATANRKAVQVVLKDTESDANLLKDPYLLIEGYASENAVRIVEGGSNQTGQEIRVDAVKAEVLQSALTKLLSNNAF